MLKFTPEENLIEQYLKGDVKSFDILVEKYLKPIYGFIYKNVGNVSDAEDITQEVFIKVWKNLKKFDCRKNFKPWIFQIAKNASIDFLRKKKTIPFTRFENNKGHNSLIESIAAPPLNLIKGLGDKATLAAAMRLLSEKERRIMNLRHNEGLSFKEIAEVSGESINTVKSRHHRTLLSIRKNIKR